VSCRRRALLRKSSNCLLGRWIADQKFLFIRGCVEAIVLKVEQYIGSEPINIGMGEEASIKMRTETVDESTRFTRNVIRVCLARTDSHGMQLNPKHSPGDAMAASNRRVVLQ